MRGPTGTENHEEPLVEQIQMQNRYKRNSVAPSIRASSSLLPLNELRMSGSKNEPPSRPSVDWSKQRPYFGPDMVRNVSVELGKTAYLTCKVYELGDKTVSCVFHIIYFYLNKLRILQGSV